MRTWQGVFPAVTTKLTEDGSIDLEETQRSLNRLIEGGVSGVIVLPMLGENASMRQEEKELVIRAAKEVVAGRVPLLSGLAETSGAAATSNARRFQEWGAEGLMVFPSIGYRTDPRETAGWYRAIAAASDLPIMIYNNPIAYGVDVTPAILGELVDCASVVAIKEETGDVRRVTDLLIAHGDRFGIFCGVDDQILESVALGVIGWVSGMTNVWPRECVELYDLCMAGKLIEARRLYHILTPSFHLDTHVKLVQYIKLAEQLVCGSPEWTRSPRLPLVGGEREMVIETIGTAVDRLRERALRSAA
jgi:4-hydroxy-tetrahydrodipicolinate synthase